MSVKTARSGFQRKTEPVALRSAGSFFHLADKLALFKMQRVFKSVTANDRVKIFG